MVELVDSPLVLRRRKNRFIPWVLGMAAVLLLIIVSFSRAAVIPVNNAQGLEVQLDFKGYKNVSSKGEFVFPRNKPVTYSVTFINHTNLSLNKLEMQTMLQAVNGHVPGASFSPVRETSLAPG